MDIKNFFFVYQANYVIIVRTVQKKISMNSGRGIESLKENDLSVFSRITIYPFLVESNYLTRKLRRERVR